MIDNFFVQPVNLFDWVLAPVQLALGFSELKINDFDGGLVFVLGWGYKILFFLLM